MTDASDALPITMPTVFIGLPSSLS
jgi:hypothetical protein